MSQTKVCNCCGRDANAGNHDDCMSTKHLMSGHMFYGYASTTTPANPRECRYRFTDKQLIRMCKITSPGSTK